MSRCEKTPVNQVRLTNVAIVRYRKKGKRFEIACYKNKVVNWRNGIETDPDEVLQVHHVFLNVSRGTVAKKADLINCFGTDDETKVCKVILEKGNLQVSQKERNVEQEAQLKDIATIIAQKCVNSETKKPFSINVIEAAMKELNFRLNPKRNAKQQALALVDQLKTVIPLQRAQMRVRLVLPKATAKQLKQQVQPMLASVEQEEWAGDFEMIVLIDPGHYRSVAALTQQVTRGQGTIEVLDLQVKDMTDTHLT